MDYTKLQNGSDIRGVAMEGIEGQHVNLTEQACRDIGRGFALWLRARLGKDTLRVAVGRDSRLSGPQLALWLMEAMAAEGLQVTDLGEYNSCAHHCRYCYANFDEAQIARRRALHDPQSTLLIGHVQPDDQIITKKKSERQLRLF